MERLGRLPLFVLMIGISGAMMLIPAGYAAVTHYHDISRIFLLSAVLMLASLHAATGQRPQPALAFACAFFAPLARETALILPLILIWWRWTIG